MTTIESYLVENVNMEALELACYFFVRSSRFWIFRPAPLELSFRSSLHGEIDDTFEAVSKPAFS